MPFYEFEYVYTTDNKEIKTTTNKVVVLTATPLGVGGGGSVIDYPSKKVKKELELNLAGIKAIPFFLAVSLVGDKAFVTKKILALIGQILQNTTTNINIAGIYGKVVKDQKDIEAILTKKVIKIDTLFGTVQNDFLNSYSATGTIAKNLMSLRFMIGIKDMHPEVVKVLIRTAGDEEAVETMSSILGSKLFTVGLDKLILGTIKGSEINLTKELQGKRDIRKIILSLFSVD